jgi:hypothetical protein
MAYMIQVSARILTEGRFDWLRIISAGVGSCRACIRLFLVSLGNYNGCFYLRSSRYKQALATGQRANLMCPGAKVAMSLLSSCAWLVVNKDALDRLIARVCMLHREWCFLVTLTVIRVSN